MNFEIFLPRLAVAAKGAAIGLLAAMGEDMRRYRKDVKAARDAGKWPPKFDYGVALPAWGYGALAGAAGALGIGTLLPMEAI